MILQENTKQKITHSSDVADVLTKLLKMESEIDQEKEHFWVIGLNRRAIVKFIDLVTLGISEMTVIDPRQTFRLAVTKNAERIIIAHNHPSGNLSPSASDIELTKRMEKSGDILGVQVVDSMIITTNKKLFYSFADEGKI